MKNWGIILAVAVLTTACTTMEPAKNGRVVPEQPDHASFNQLAKGDFDRLADIEMRETTQSLRLLMTKLYKRNPNELHKSTSGTAEEMVNWVFDGDHGWKFKEINAAQGTDAIFLAFKPEYQGDRVLPFIVGLQTMLVTAHGGKSEFYFTDRLDPQRIYNAARNVEIATWKLSNARNEQGQLYLLTNEINEVDRNLSFEREFGKIIGRTDLFAIGLAEKSQRLITRIMQNLATALFLPF